MAMFEQQLGCLMLQLPASFGPNRTLELEQFLLTLPKDFHYALEVRHMAWFDKADNETWLNRTLKKYNINRVIMDTRGLFSCHTPSDTLVMEVQSKKPKVPAHVVATDLRPIVRFVGHPKLENNVPFLIPWVHKVAQWLELDMQPYFFFHMPDNALAPWLAELFFEQFNLLYPNKLPKLKIPPMQPPQLSIF